MKNITKQSKYTPTAYHLNILVDGVYILAEIVKGGIFTRVWIKKSRPKPTYKLIQCCILNIPLRTHTHFLFKQTGEVLRISIN